MMLAAALLALPCLSATLAWPTATSDQTVMAPPRPPPTTTFRFSTALGHDMVLQAAPLQAVVWGVCAAGTAAGDITVRFAGKEVATTVGVTLGQATWMAKLPSTPASFDPVNISATSKGVTVTLTNVLFGDVWVCSGQSNMQMPLGSPTCWNASNEDCKLNPRAAQCGYGCVKDAGVEIADMANYPNMRLHNNEHEGSSTPLLESRNSGWMAPAKMGGAFSATCWFFGRDLYKSLTPARPLGLIETNVGGTPDQHWSSPDALNKCKNLPGAPAWEWPANFKDSVLWNGKVVPYLKTTVLGAIWYQGEANAGADGRQYNCSFQAMIQDWRLKWSQGTDGATAPNFSFGWAQLNSVGGAANFNHSTTPAVPTPTDPLGQWSPGGGAGGHRGVGGYAYLRNAQAHTLALPNTFQAVILDTPCSSGSVHSPYKQPVGARLARQALATQYSVLQPSPVATAVSQRSCDMHQCILLVTVGGLGGGELEALATSSPLGFETLAKGNWVSTPVVSVANDTVTLSGVPAGATAVRYLWRSTPCGMKTFGCPVYLKTTALGTLTGEHDYLPLAPFIMSL